MNDTAASRIRKQLEAPTSLMGGESFLLNIHNIQELLAENDRLAQKIEALESEIMAMNQFPAEFNRQIKKTPR